MQTQDRTFRIPSITDKVVLDTFEKIAKLSDDATFWVEIAGVHSANWTDASEFTNENSGHWTKSRIITRAGCTFGTPALNVLFHRSTTSWDQNNHARATPSAWENEFYLYWRSDRGDPPADIRVEIAQIVSHLQHNNFKPSAAADAFTDAMAIQVARLADMQASILEDAENKRREHEQSFEQRRLQLDSEHSSLVAQLRSSELEAKDRVASETSRLEARRKELDDRGHMHARRQLRADITRMLGERLRRPPVSITTLALRFVVGIVTLLGIALASYIAFVSAREIALLLSNEKDALATGFTPLNRIALYIVMARLGASSAVAVGLLFYLLGWLRRMLDQDERVERELERYRYDIDRASWAIETILEVQNKEGGSIPTEWVSGVTHGLFRTSVARDEDTTALEALGALLNISAKAEIGPGGTKIEVGKKGLRQIGREAEELHGG